MLMAGWMMVIHECFRRAPLCENKWLHIDVFLLHVNNELQQLEALIFDSKEQRTTVAITSITKHPTGIPSSFERLATQRKESEIQNHETPCPHR